MKNIEKIAGEIFKELDMNKQKIIQIAKQILAKELYHVTTYSNAINILMHNYFRVSPGTISIKGLSTTTNKKYWWGSKEVRFVLDPKKLSPKFELKDIDEKLGVKEDEIKIINDSAILNANKYLKRIEFFEKKDKQFDNFKKQLSEYLQKNKIKTKVLK